jgi:hypothetical protein
MRLLHVCTAAHLVSLLKVLLEVDHVLVVQPAQDVNLFEDVLTAARDANAGTHAVEQSCRVNKVAVAYRQWYKVFSSNKLR